ncbi:MAG: hypothetical protein [Cressdnaviricota sp.]|nr:MAG: hypothetical protein [Cressdnaviricota sp.]
MKLNKGELDEVILGLQQLREELNTHEDSKATDWTLITINPYLISLCNNFSRRKIKTASFLFLLHHRRLFVSPNIFSFFIVIYNI